MGVKQSGKGLGALWRATRGQWPTPGWRQALVHAGPHDVYAGRTPRMICCHYKLTEALCTSHWTQPSTRHGRLCSPSTHPAPGQAEMSCNFSLAEGFILPDPHCRIWVPSKNNQSNRESSLHFMDSPALISAQGRIWLGLWRGFGLTGGEPSSHCGGKAFWKMLYSHQHNPSSFDGWLFVGGTEVPSDRHQCRASPDSLC